MINITVDSLNGTSLEDIKDMTLNMKIPHSLSTKTKTEAEMSKQNISQSLPQQNNFSQQDGEPIASL